MIRMILGKKFKVSKSQLQIHVPSLGLAMAQQISGFEFKNATQKSARLGLIAIGLHLTKTHMCKLLAKS